MCRVDACDSPARKHLTETTPRYPVPSVDVGGVNHPLTIATFFMVFLLLFFITITGTMKTFSVMNCRKCFILDFSYQSE